MTQCRQETEGLAILTGLEIDSAKSGVKPDLSQYLGSSRGRKSLFCGTRPFSKKAPEAGAEPNVNFGHLSSDFPELVDEKGNGWFHRHVKNIIKFLRKHPDLISKPNQKNVEKLAQGFTTAWKKKVRQMQIPAFALNTKAAWCLRFDDILADALEQGPLQNHEIVLSQEVIDHLKAQTSKGFPDTLLPMLMQYYLSHGGETEEWVVLPVSAVEIYYGSTTFSRKKKTLPKDVIKFKEAYGICKFNMIL